VANAASVAVIINPISGTGGRADVARRRTEQARALIEQRGLGGHVVLTERPGHARELARAALEQGASTILAWGGDGTVNEVASALAFRPETFAIIPSGSGNGLARTLKIPFDPERAFEVAFSGRSRIIDAGELDGHLFFNIAGLGLDARVAHRFAANGLVRRGFLRYLEITASELLKYAPDDHTVTVDGDSVRHRSLLLAIANARQYGNGALIAPQAIVDDGRLDVVIVGHRSPLMALLQVPLVFAGLVGRLPGVTVRTGVDIEITSANPLVYHVDGEPFVGGPSLKARIHPHALRIRVPS
jgi:YegS/Rv2252/BmrU family lipid kinase